MLKDMYTLFSENKTDPRVCLKMKGRMGIGWGVRDVWRAHHHRENVGITLKG